MRLLFPIIFLCLCFDALQAQTSKDATVPITATLNTGPTSITLVWANPGMADLLILRRTKGQAGNGWVQLLNVAGSNFNTLTDNGVANGAIYEYVVQRVVNGVFAFGYVHVAINANPVNSRGKVLIFVDSTTANALVPELSRLKDDLRGDGYWPITFHTGPSSTVKSVKDQIIASYNADVLNVKSVLLLGNVPIPYSGNANWDGHAEHAGAWPSDAYYADVNGVWTDVSVNNVTPARAANDNIPGDGKFDQNFIPSIAELQVGRVDFRRINAPAFGAADAIGLMKRYLDKNHRWRTGNYPVQNKALVDDNFGYFGGEAFAANGFRNAYPLVGEANIVEADFFNDTNPQSYLMGYACGPGTYQSAGGVGSSANFATDSVNVVFSNLFGSYHGDWDFETDPFMPSALAARGGILTCSWAGRPHWFEQYLASGESIGYSTLETMNSQFNLGFFGSSGESGAHVALLGDPTLRANAVKPATNLALSAPSCNSVAISWAASADLVTGYHVYRAPSQDGPYTRLTTNPIAGLNYTDNAPPLDTLYYQVRAIKNVSNPGGGTYANNAVGPIKSIIFTGAGGPTVSATGGTLNCMTASVMLTASPSAPITTWSWAGPNNYSSSMQNPTVTLTGPYTVTAFDASGCSATATATVVGDYAAPNITSMVSNTLNCVNTSATITVTPAGLASCIITGPGNTFVQDFSATVTQPGTYNIAVVSSVNGCIGNGSIQVLTDMAIPSVSASNSGPITCANSNAQLMASSIVPGASFAWSGPCVNGSTATCAGVYMVVATNPLNGCTNTATTTVVSDTNTPTATALGGVLTCETLSIPLTASTNAPNATFIWSGPCVSAGPPVMATCAGVYTVVVTNTANGCTNTATATVTEDVQPPNLNLPTPPPLTCTVLCYAFIAPVIPGIELYIAGQLIPPGSSIQFCQPGTIEVTIKSTANGCSTTQDMVITQDVTPPNANAGQDQVISCNNPSVQIFSTGSSTGANFALLWTGPGGYTSIQPNPSVILPGSYNLLITNTANGCTASDQVLVSSDPSLPTVNATVSGQLNCSNQSVQLQSGNDDPGAQFAWGGPNGFSSTSSDPIVSEPGTYQVAVSVGSCFATDVVEVIKATDLIVTSNPVVLNCDGIITTCLNISGGTMPYNILWSNGSTTNCATFTGTSTIGVSVTDAGGCSFQSTQTIVVPPTISATVTSTYNCNGSFNVCAMAMGGSPPYTYQWSNGGTTPCTISNGMGNLLLSITDAAGCIKSVNVLVSQPPLPISLSSVVTNESAPNANNGAINLTPAGGTPPYQYSWNTGATTEDISGLAGGVYTVTVTDANGCTRTSTATVLTTSGTEETAFFELFQLSPNPTEGQALLSLKLVETAKLRIEIRDAAGRLIWESPGIKTEQLNLPIDLSNSPAGMYSVSVWVENQVFVRKLAVVR
ncbi:MAG: T9SS type A sorting domain-containing protein [Saprospiraceae bacterium]